jgi:hypothetical protein
VCRLPPDAGIPQWVLREGRFTSVTRTADELSLVCSEGIVPPDARAERGWLCLKLHGPFQFAETGILTALVNPLSGASIPIFALSTFDTDYVLIKEEFWDRAQGVLREAGHEWVPTPQVEKKG